MQGFGVGDEVCLCVLFDSDKREVQVTVNGSAHKPIAHNLDLSMYVRACCSVAKAGDCARLTYLAFLR